MKYRKLSEMTREELNKLTDDEVRPYIRQWFEYLLKLLDHAAKGRKEAVRVFNTLNDQKKELLYVLMFCIKPEWREYIVKVLDRLSKIEQVK